MAAAFTLGSSSAQLVHHVAQNSRKTGFFPIHCPRSTAFPSRSCTVTTGALSPTATPVCAAAGAAQRSPVMAAASTHMVILGSCLVIGSPVGEPVAQPRPVPLKET